MRPLVFACWLLPLWAFGQKISPDNISIARDRWGMPHIFAPTDAEVAYGLAWANCEDHFFEIQASLAAGQGTLGLLQGKEGATIDYVLQAVGIRDTVRKYWPEGFSEGYRRYLDGYVQGVNAYAAAHPDQVRQKGAFPVSHEEILCAYLSSGVLFVGFADQLRALYEQKPGPEPAKGSNAFAMAPVKTADGRTYICGNPHFTVDGNFSFYEAHLCSEEGLNVVGALFQGSHSIALGCTPDLAWSHTWNYFDATDMWKLEMHPRKKGWYRYDGQWLRLSRKSCKLKVKIGGTTFRVRKKAWASVHGPVFHIKKKGWFAVQTAALGAVRMAEQVYRTNRATGFEEFKKVFEGQQLPMFNTVYADRASNIYYVCNARFPTRPVGADPSGPMRGDTSATAWRGIAPFAALPQILNPDCGFVYNTNNSPYLSACSPVGPKLPPAFDLRPGQNNRALRFRELVDAHEGPFSFETFKSLKFDCRYSARCHARQALKPLAEMPESRFPELADALRCIRLWDGSGAPTNCEAPTVALTLDYMFNRKGYGDEAFVNGIETDTALLVEGLRFARKYLMEKHGRVQVPIDSVFRLQRGGRSFSTVGFPDALLATYFQPDEKGRYRVVHGDSYVFFAAFGREPLQSVETLLPYGASVGSPVYESQLELYRNGKLKTVHFDKQRTLKEAVKVYSPR
jgi:acyl-homoserine-lactone acylase